MRLVLLTFVVLSSTTACSSGSPDVPSPNESGGANGADEAASGGDVKGVPVATSSASTSQDALDDPRKGAPAAWRDAPDVVIPSLPGADCPSAPLAGHGPLAAFATGVGGRAIAGLTESGDVVLVSGGQSARVIPELHGAVAVAAGDEHVCALMPGGTVSCAGTGRLWLGDNAKDARFRVRAIDLSARTTSPVVQIVAGGGASCALTTDRRVLCWGYDNFIAGPGLTRYGANDDDHENKNPSLWELTNPFASPVKSLATSGEHVCALLDDGSVTCFGNDSLGQLGNGNPSFLLGAGGALTTNPAHKTGMPLALVPLSAPADVVAVGYLNGCAIGNGAVECWGDDGSGQLGDLGAQLQSLTPKALPLSSLGLAGAIEELVVDDGLACARSNEGELACWGRGPSGTVTAPALVDLKGHSAHSLRISGARACALLEDKNVCCF